jgi:uncharacterized protein (DUF2249 family)
VLCIIGNYFGILSKLDLGFHELEIRLASVFRLMTILEEGRSSLILVEHDPRPTRTPER